MPQHLLSVHGVDEGSYATPEDRGRTFRDVDALNQEFREQGAWVFAGGLQPSSTARVVRSKDGALLHTDGPYLEGKEHIGGFWIIEAPDDDARCLGAAARRRVPTSRSRCPTGSGAARPKGSRGRSR
jgi:hypothetical protein